MSIPLAYLDADGNLLHNLKLVTIAIWFQARGNLPTVSLTPWKLSLSVSAVSK